jgi:hypothetical protein
MGFRKQKLLTTVRACDSGQQNQLPMPSSGTRDNDHSDRLVELELATVK